jgi:hypothetical protein
MKTRVLYLITVLMLMFASAVLSQTCVDPLRMISYDTTVIGSGNAYHAFTFPKFDPSIGTLMEVRLESEVTLRYSFQLENRESININNYRVRVTRDDEISGAALLNPITYSQIRTYGPYALSAWDGTLGAGSDYVSFGPVYVMNHARSSQTVYNTADYLGNGTVSFDYASTTYSSVLGSVNYTFNGTAQDTIQLRLTYAYCATWFLKSDVLIFNATKNKEDQIDLQWRTEKDVQGRSYEIQKSYDGRSFETVASRIAQPTTTGTSDYRYTYTLRPGDDKPKLIFRLKQVDRNGEIKYSSIRILEIKPRETQKMRVYPNPARSTTQLIFNNSKRGNWQVDLIGMNGVAVKKFEFRNAITGRIDGLQSLPKGIYLLRATEKTTGEVLKERLLVN